MPINDLAVVETLEAQEIKPMFQDPLRPADESRGLFREPLAKKCNQLGN
jgi:hypothetical protein